MSFEPVNIKIKDTRSYTEIAYIIDRPLFIKEAKKLREKYGIKKPLGKVEPREWFTRIMSLKKKSQISTKI